MSCGAALLMETSPNGLDELFTPGEELLPTYPRNDARAAANIAAAALAKPEQLAEIAQAGRRAVSRRHTDTVRAASLAHILAGLCADQAHKPRLEVELERRAALVRAAYGMPLTLTRPARISSSALRREHRPEAAMALFRRAPSAPAVSASGFAASLMGAFRPSLAKPAPGPWATLCWVPFSPWRATCWPISVMVWPTRAFATQRMQADAAPCRQTAAWPQPYAFAWACHCSWHEELARMAGGGPQGEALARSLEAQA